MRTGSDVKGQRPQVDLAQEDRRRGNDSSGRGILYVIGIGPGDIEHMTLRAYRLLQEVEVLVGYKTYIELLADIISPDQEVVSTGMTKEVERCRKAIGLAREGKMVGIVSSGDAGVYGMAGLILELIKEENIDLEVQIVPGITAANAAASSLGAPLMHDYAVISLSDLLTPWEVIEKRVEKAAEGDFIVALYNPKSKKRVEQIERAREIFLKERGPKTPVGIVRQAKRGDERVVLTDLEGMLEEDIDMLTMVIIGNSQTFSSGGLMITPRGYNL